jgi:hypothetical protein
MTQMKAGEAWCLIQSGRAEDATALADDAILDAALRTGEEGAGRLDLPLTASGVTNQSKRARVHFLTVDGVDAIFNSQWQRNQPS